ncbi:MAG: HAMP domain-containing histidine kinase [Chloroflexi bacterium]|nr:HAMP domain-containing histidine kinase [Chloroflexota bacterium]
MAAPHLVEDQPSGVSSAPNVPSPPAAKAADLRLLSGQRAPTSAWLELRIHYIRWIGVAFIIPALVFLPIGGAYRWYLLGVVLFAALYNSTVPFLIKHKVGLLLPLVTACDGVAAAAFVYISGFNSQQYVVLYSIVVATAMRMGLGMVLVMCGLFAGLDFTQGILSGQLVIADSLFRGFFLTLVGILSAVLYQYAKREEELTRQANEQLQVANQELRALDDMKSTFISNASHELRTPLTSIRSFSEMLREDPDLERDTRLEFVTIINSESERLSRLVNNLLDLGRIQQGGRQWQPEIYDVAGDLRTLAAEQQPLAAAKGLDLWLDVPEALPRVEADRDAIRQVLLNLAGNALKFTERGHIRIRASVERARVAIAVEDTGVGISAEDQARVFDRFFQTGDVLTAKPEGSGLGLAICKEILDQHGSDLQLQSTQGQGSVFTFWLPLAATHPAA